MLALLYHKALCAVKGSLHVLLMLVPVLLSGCAALKYGSSSDVIIKSASGEAECVDITVSGKKSDAAYLNVTLPFTMKVKHDNLPLAVSVASKDNVYSDFAINAKRVGKTESALWLFCGGSVLGSGIVALALDGAYDVFDGDGYRNLAFIACGGALALYWGYLTKINVPERGEYSVAPVSPEDSCYARALLAKPVVHVMGEGEVRMERCGLVFSYKTDSDGKVCSLGTAEGLTVIGYDRCYSRIRKVACGKMCFYSVEKVVDGKTRYGACDMLGREIVPVKYKEKLKVFGGSIGVKAGKPITGLAEHVCGDEGNAKLGADFNEAALELIAEKRYGEALQKLMWSVYVDNSDTNDAYYLLGHYYCFGNFGEAALSGGQVERGKLAPVDSLKGIEYLGRSYSVYAADVFADKAAWTYNPAKALRMYRSLMDVGGDNDWATGKIRSLLADGKDFPLDKGRQPSLAVGGFACATDDASCGLTALRQSCDGGKDSVATLVDSLGLATEGASCAPSSGCEVVDGNVVLYLRVGDNAKPLLRGKALCRKGASYYVNIDGRYFLVRRSGWRRFGGQISYGGELLYFD